MPALKGNNSPIGSCLMGHVLAWPAIEQAERGCRGDGLGDGAGIELGDRRFALTSYRLARPTRGRRRRNSAVAGRGVAQTFPFARRQRPGTGRDPLAPQSGGDGTVKLMRENEQPLASRGLKTPGTNRVLGKPADKGKPSAR